MGKSLIQQRRGMGYKHIQYRAPKIGKLLPTSYPPLHEDIITGTVERIVHERGRIAPLAQIRVGNRHYYIPAARGVEVGHMMEIGSKASVRNGNVTILKNVPEGTAISNIEKQPGDGGKLVKSAGTSAVVFSQSGENSIVRFPSGKTVLVKGQCRATVGVVAGGGFGEKPFLKAGTRFHKMEAQVKMYPRMRGIAMAAVHHPFGGGRHQHVGMSSSSSRNASPGSKVGHIAPKKTGRKRIRKTLEVR